MAPLTGVVPGETSQDSAALPICGALVNTPHSGKSERRSLRCSFDLASIMLLPRLHIRSRNVRRDRYVSQRRIEEPAQYSICFPPVKCRTI